VLQRARALGVLDDTWSLLLLRELFLGINRFDLTQDRPGIACNNVAARLRRRLIAAGLTEKRPCHPRLPRFDYHFTPKGVDRHSIILGLMQVGDPCLADPSGGPLLLDHRDCGQL
jgi:DNA-binding HxlR family transcriptional regulator